jgi:hypothetical protein
MCEYNRPVPIDGKLRFCSFHPIGRDPDMREHYAFHASGLG